ncbi:MAG: hypothetical protein ACXABY_26710 [Candidatus Thorarchaeota archaeon]|jgi:hypothetical protein
MAGGGGGSGKVEYPAYMETQHENWLDDVEVIIQANLSSASPYNGVNAYDPDADIALAQSATDAFETTVLGIDDSVDWLRLIDVAITKADEVLFDTDVLDDARTAFNNRSEDEYLNGVNSLSDSAAGVGAVDSSAFSIALALLEMDRERRVDDFDANLQFELYKIRGQFLLQGTEQMARILYMRMTGEQAATQIQANLTNSKIISKKEEADRNLEIDVQDALYDIKLFSYGSSVLAGITGGVPIPKEPGTAASALSGAAGGLALGASTGNPWIALAGGALGGIAGLLQ